MNDVVATIIRNDIDILDEITELEAEAALDAGPGPGNQISLVFKLSAHFISDACELLLNRKTHSNV